MQSLWLISLTVLRQPAVAQCCLHISAGCCHGAHELQSFQMQISQSAPYPHAFNIHFIFFSLIIYWSEHFYIHYVVSIVKGMIVLFVPQNKIVLFFNQYLVYHLSPRNWGPDILLRNYNIVTGKYSWMWVNSPCSPRCSTLAFKTIIDRWWEAAKGCRLQWRSRRSFCYELMRYKHMQTMPVNHNINKTIPQRENCTRRANHTSGHVFVIRVD